jgi:CBS-domain-containing membrane protein
LIAVIRSTKIHVLGCNYAVLPVGFGALIMLIVVLIVNRMAKRDYPIFWL